MPHPPAHETVGKIVARQQRRRRHDHRAELHRSQHAFPQRHHIAEHDQDAVAAAHAETAQRIGDLVRPLAQARERELYLSAVVVDEPQRRLRIVARHDIEIIERPVETIELRPFEIAVGGGVILAMAQQEIARGNKRRRVARDRVAHNIALMARNSWRDCVMASARYRGSCSPRRARYAAAAAQSLYRF